MISKSHFRLKKNGELGSRCFCRHPELIENYEKAIADTAQVWDCHHRREEFYSQKELKERGEYYDVPPDELIFLTKSEHYKMDSACKRISEAMKGKKQPPLSEETKRKMSEAHKGKPANNKRKVLCVETGEVFESLSDTTIKIGIAQSSISQVCNGKRKSAGGYHWSFI